MIHTYEDLKNNALKNNVINTCKQDCYDDQALKAYDYMLLYLKENGISCKIYNCYYYKNGMYDKYHYEITFVLSEYSKEFEKESSVIGLNESKNSLCTILCNKERTEIITDVFQFLCARKLEEDLKADMKVLYPNYYINFNIRERNQGFLRIR